MGNLARYPMISRNSRQECGFIDSVRGIYSRKLKDTRLATAESGFKTGFLHDPDTRLMLRVQVDDQSAFEQLVSSYQDRLVNLLFHQLGDQQTAEDVTQEVFLRVYKARHTYQPTARFSTWLFHIANNLASNSRRSKFRRREVDIPSSPSGKSPSPSDLAPEKSALMPARMLDRQEIQNVVQEAVQSLSERHRMAVLLHKFEEMSYADIAATMELSVPAVKSLLARAREALREKLLPYLGKAGDLLSSSGEIEQRES